MKLSKVLHVVSVLVGTTGVIIFAAIGIASLRGDGELVFGVTKTDALLCVVILLLIGTWIQLATIHHMMLEKRGEII